MATRATGSSDALVVTSSAVTPRRRARLTQERSWDTRRRLARTAMPVWTERGFETGIEDTTTDEIVHAAGPTKGAFCFHFAHEEEIRLELGYQTAALLQQEADRRLAAGRSLAGSLRRMTNTLAASVKAAPRAAAGRAMSEMVQALRTDSRLAWSQGRLPSLGPALQRRVRIVAAGLRPGAAFPSSAR